MNHVLCDLCSKAGVDRRATICYKVLVFDGPAEYAARCHVHQVVLRSAAMVSLSAISEEDYLVATVMGA